MKLKNNLSEQYTCCHCVSRCVQHSLFSGRNYLDILKARTETEINVFGDGRLCYVGGVMNEFIVSREGFEYRCSGKLLQILGFVS